MYDLIYNFITNDFLGNTTADLYEFNVILTHVAIILLFVFLVKVFIWFFKIFDWVGR